MRFAYPEHLLKGARVAVPRGPPKLSGFSILKKVLGVSTLGKRCSGQAYCAFSPKVRNPSTFSWNSGCTGATPRAGAWGQGAYPEHLFQGAYPGHLFSKVHTPSTLFRFFLPHEKVLGLLQSPPPEHLWPNCTSVSTFCKGARVVAIGKKVPGSLQ